MIESLTAKLGEPDEIHQLHNTIRVWNDLGIYCYTKPDSSNIHDISFGFSIGDADFHPTQPFAGVISVNIDHIHMGTNKAALKLAGFKPSPYIYKQYTKEIGSISIFVDTVGA